ncbi:MAG: thioredoxin domain-containing protein [Gemmatimonadaceae bacterium]
MATKKPASSKNFTVILVVVGLAGVAILGWATTRPVKTLVLDPAALPRVAAAGILKGDPNAPVQVVEFADFECPGCGYYATVTGPDVARLLVETGEISFRFVDLPLSGHLNSVAAHNAAHCAHEQGKFWEMHDRIFNGQHEWNTQATRAPKKVLERYARAVGVDIAQWNECYDSERMLPQILANRTEAERLRVSSTPTFLIGNRMVPGNVSYDQFRAYVLEAKVAAAMRQPGDRATVPVP